ncbi:hypothetical protein KPH14_009000 [Odynerus spinipes]|uniref:Uncharacterized protein n=1 Tax=Odynerus spinipes TaxID=1348599 RepID=A0AAD9RNE4_9HYME|nr:hypothetical protein KPH14_009000 [Odynerus spinipes]
MKGVINLSPSNRRQAAGSLAEVTNCLDAVASGGSVHSQHNLVQSLGRYSCPLLLRTPPWSRTTSKTHPSSYQPYAFGGSNPRTELPFANRIQSSPRFRSDVNGCSLSGRRTIT